ncbi:MAG: hypothetical protein FJZ43_02200 [Candidatus Staskawiczbacteria bacterium]|nr:hypothetical protein [Candidatus Staskawiczbacteria bacterium]
MKDKVRFSWIIATGFLLGIIMLSVLLLFIGGVIPSILIYLLIGIIIVGIYGFLISAYIALANTLLSPLTISTLKAHRSPTFEFVEVAPSNKPEDVARTIMQSSQLTMIVLDFDRDAWTLEYAVVWIRCFRVFYQEFLFNLRQSGQVEKKDVVITVPMVIVFGRWQYPDMWDKLVYAGACVFDRAVRNMECHTIEQLKEHFAKLIS